MSYKTYVLAKEIDVKDVVEKKDDFPSTSNLTKIGISAIGYSAAGIFLFILNNVTENIVPGLIVGGIVTLFGIISLRSKYSADKKAGIIITIAGILTLLSKTGIPFIAAGSKLLMIIGAIGLLALGIWNSIKFFRGLKKRT